MSAVSAVTELDALLAPISEEKPVGEDLRSVMIDAKRDQVYWHDKIREARREDLFSQVPKKPDWRVVIDLGTQALTKRTKDLQLAAWLAEAFVGYDKHDRFAGLRDGLKLMRGLIEHYWDQIYPPSDPEDTDGHFTARVNLISVLESSLATAIKQIPLTNGQSGMKLSFNQWEESKQFDIPENAESLSGEQFERVETLKKQAVDEGKTTSESWRKSHNTTSYEHYKERLDLLNECWDELQALDEVMDEHFQREAPGLRSLLKSLDEVRTLVEKLEREKRPVDVEVEQQSIDGEGGGELSLTSGAVRSRQEALRRLAEVAEYFRRTEPHSPLSYLIQRAVRWGNMTLDQLLIELIKDGGVLGHVRETLGMQSDSNTDSSENSE